MSLLPFFTYYGGKWRVAPRYPGPRHRQIVEPFAGSAGYALRYADREVLLCDADPVLAGLWRYLISVTPGEILRLPDLRDGETVDALAVPQEARWLIGFWLNKGAAAPRKTPSRWMRDGLRPGSYWGQKIRERIASQVEKIRHWRVYDTDYRCAEIDLPATYFVDPPYANAAGRYYRKNAISYLELGDWCRGLRGQVIVCENDGAAWLPFRPFHAAKAREGRGGGRVSYEAIWTNQEESRNENRI